LAAQSVVAVAVVQVPLHDIVLASQRNPPPHVVAAGVTQVPVPLQVDAAVCVALPAGQEAPGRHAVPGAARSQAPAPSQSPVLPQTLLPLAQEVVFLGIPVMALQIPRAVPEMQLLQGDEAAVQAASQQTFSSEQTFERQSVLATQVAPAPSLSPQRLFVLMHVVPVQSASDVQVVRHEVFALSQTKGAHVVGVGVVHVPLALQVPWLCCMPAVQLCLLQLVLVE
jgi:hypothetical protein